MSEVTSIKVSNWGDFFLRKIQIYFNKAQHCDLTLQFHDTSQLKVHRLVLNSFTDYFHILEQTSEITDDNVVILPLELKSEEILPIIHFMYTGVLKYDFKYYIRLLDMARIMKMKLLIQILEVNCPQKTIESHIKSSKDDKTPLKTEYQYSSVVTTHHATSIPTNNIISTVDTVQSEFKKTTSLLNNIETVAVSSSSDQKRNVSFASYNKSHIFSGNSPVALLGRTVLTRIKPIEEQLSAKVLFQKLKDYQDQQQAAAKASMHLEQPAQSAAKCNKRRYSRSTNTDSTSPPCKKTILQDVNALNEQRDNLINQLLDKESSNYCEEKKKDEFNSNSGRSMLNESTVSLDTRVVSKQQAKIENLLGSVTMFIKYEGPDIPASITITGDKAINLNYNEIASEFLRQYPHYLEKKKIVTLKIMQNEVIDESTISPKQEMPTAAAKPNAFEISSTTPVAGAVAAPTKTRPKVSIKTLNALIALGAENTTGPWFCLRCGRNGNPISIPTYAAFRFHLTNTHKEIIDPALCATCGYRSANERDLHFHMKSVHNKPCDIYVFPKCELCYKFFINCIAFEEHFINDHPNEGQLLYKYLKDFQKNHFYGGDLYSALTNVEN